MTTPSQRAKQQEADGIASFFLVFVILTIPFLVVSVCYYLAWKKKYLGHSSIHRIIDPRKAIGRLWRGGSILAGFAAASFMLFVLVASYSTTPSKSSSYIVLLLMLFAIIAVLTLGYLTGKGFAAALIGVLFDKDRGTVTFPTDGVLRSFSNISVVLSAIVPHTLETLALRQISSVTRQSGTALLLYGDFGSRVITFSDKLRRDECLSLLSRHAKVSGYDGGPKARYA